MASNRGAFYIKAEDVSSTDSFKVPGDRTGYTPDDTKNPEQLSYSIDEHRTDISKQYYVHVKNGWDANVDVSLNGSSFEDKEMNKAILEQTSKTVSSGGGVQGFEDDTGHSFLEVEITNISGVPTEGVLEIVIQSRYR